MSPRTSITAAVLDKILAFLTPLFVIVGTTDTTAAKEVARATLASYGARTDRELRFAALSIAFSFGALEALCKAANPELALNQVLRLSGNANALNRAAHQNEARLEKLLKQPPVNTEAEVETPPEAPTVALPISTATNDLLVFARSRAKAAASDAPVAMQPAPLSRQQRRAAERQAEKMRKRQLEAAKLAQRALQRAAAVSGMAHQSA